MAKKKISKVTKKPAGKKTTPRKKTAKKGTQKNGVKKNAQGRFVVGTGKPEGSGRKKGQLNRTTIAMRASQELYEEHKVQYIQAILRFRLMNPKELAKVQEKDFYTKLTPAEQDAFSHVMKAAAGDTKSSKYINKNVLGMRDGYGMRLGIADAMVTAVKGISEKIRHGEYSAEEMMHWLDMRLPHLCRTEEEVERFLDFFYKLLKNHNAIVRSKNEASKHDGFTVDTINLVFKSVARNFKKHLSDSPSKLAMITEDLQADMAGIFGDEFTARPVNAIPAETSGGS